MLTVRLDEETEACLADILAHDKTDKSELIRRLIDERWLALQSGKQTVLERLGGHHSTCSTARLIYRSAKLASGRSPSAY